MYRKIFLSLHLQPSVFAIAVLFLTQLATAQNAPGLPAVEDMHDTRFVGVKEDWTTPSLSSSTLKPVDPLVMDISPHPEEYSAQLVRVQWRWTDRIDLYVLKPKGVKNPPVVLYLYSYPSETATFRDEAWQRAVTKDGFAAVGFLTALTGQRYHERPMKQWFISELQESLAVSSHDVQMVLNYLATRGDLDMDRVGMVAEGSGATVSILASAVDKRIRVLDVLNPWGDWPTWMSQSPFVPQEERRQYMTSDFLKKAETLDPVDFLSKIQAKRFRVQEALFDEQTPVASREKLLSAVPRGTPIVSYKTMKEYQAATVNDGQLDWIHQELRALPDPKASTALAAQGGNATSPDTVGPDHH